MPITVIILTQGNELLNGSILNTNMQFLGAELARYDVHVLEHRCLRDDIDSIAQTYKETLSQADIVISCGGLGPTPDDCTRNACAQAFSCSLLPHPQARKEIQEYYKKRNRACSESVLQMATLPAIASAITNPCGSAPAFSITKNGHTLFCFPGVPRELKELFAQEILPILPQRKYIPLSVGCFGAGESTLMKLLHNIPQPIHYCATRKGIRVTFHTALRDSEKKHIKKSLSPYLYAWGHSDMALSIGTLLKQREETLSTAESCTSGAISSWITSIAGASSYFLEGAAVYSNEAKIRTCAVPRMQIETYGAVSKEVATALAKGMRARTNSTWSISTTGIAGPGGGSLEKPVGTVHIAVAGPKRTIHKELYITGNRAQITASTIGHALFLLYTELK